MTRDDREMVTGPTKDILDGFSEKLHNKGHRVHSLRMSAIVDGIEHFWLNLGFADWSGQTTGWFTMAQLETIVQINTKDAA